MLVNGKKVGRGVISIPTPLSPEQQKAAFTAAWIARNARPVRRTPETADPATQSVRAAAIAAGHIKPAAAVA